MADQPARLEAATVKAEIGSGIVYRFSNDAATEEDIPTLSGDIPNLKKIILTIQQDGADKISFATKIFATTAAGIAATVYQEIFLVQVNDPDEIYAVWQNVGGTAVDTGKRSLSATAVIQATEAATAAAASAQASADAATERVARFLEPSSTNPTTRDDGQPLQFGDRYLNTVDQIEYIYKSSGWVANNLDAQTLSLPSGSNRVGWSPLETYDTDTVGYQISKISTGVAGAYTVTWKNRSVGDRLNDVIVVHEFGPVDTAANTTSTIFAAWTAATTQNKELHFIGGKGGGTGGRYDWNGGDLATSDLTIRAIGFVELHCVASGTALRLGADSGNRYRFNMLGNFKITGNASTDATGGIKIRALNRSCVQLSAWGMPGLVYDVKAGVCSDLYLVASGAGNSGITPIPTRGIEIDELTAGDYLADCRVYFVIEDVTAGGVNSINANGCEFFGTSEHVGSFGVREGSACRNNIWNRVWCEQNGGGDFLLYASTTLLSCRSLSSAVTENVQVYGSGAKLIGGYHRCVNLNAGSTDTLLQGVETSNNAALRIKGPGGKRIIGCVMSDNNGVQTGTYTDVLGNSGSWTPVPIATGGIGTSTYTSSGYFEVIGGQNFCHMTLTFTSKDAAMSGIISIGGLPIPARNVSGLSASGSIGQFSGLNSPGAGYAGLGWRINPNSNSLLLVSTGFGNNFATINASSITANTSFIISFYYPIPLTL